MSIGAFSRKTGLSMRTLRFYEAAGLITPYRNADNGRRSYAGRDLWRVQQVLVLKMVGLSLSEIHALLTRQTMNPATTLSLQLDLLVERRDALDRAIASLRAALGRVDGDGDTAIDTLFSLVKMMKMVDDSNAYQDVIKKYMTEEQVQSKAVQDFVSDAVASLDGAQG